ncbi:MAG: HAD family hydrolase [Micromonosporaceae bacterium]
MVAAPSAANSPRLLLLWDVDHTLIETRGVGRAIYDRAFPAATGVALTRLATIAGRTELDIMEESLRVNGVEPTIERIAILASALTLGYQSAREELGRIGRALPGAEKTLASLATEPAIHQTVVTGNLREVARIKLEVFGLDRYVDLTSGAYGDDDKERVNLVALSRRRASARTGVEFGADATILLGDTPNDVEAGLAAGVHVVGVATGKTSAALLMAAGAHEVTNDLHGCHAIVSRLVREGLNHCGGTL